jgi:hypothetical protein
MRQSSIAWFCYMPCRSRFLSAQSVPRAANWSKMLRSLLRCAWPSSGCTRSYFCSSAWRCAFHWARAYWRHSLRLRRPRHSWDRLFSATYLAKRAPFPSRLPLSSLTLSLCQSQCSVSRWRKRPSHRRRTRRSATRVFRKSFGKRSKNRSYGHRYSLSRSFCATSKSLRFSAMDFRF